VLPVWLITEDLKMAQVLFRPEDRELVQVDAALELELVALVRLVVEMRTANLRSNLCVMQT
jgi:hypothetical protein